MKTVEELKGMTQDELVIMVQNLQEELSEVTEDAKKYYSWWETESRNHRALKDILKNVLHFVKA